MTDTMRTLKRITVIHGIPETKCRIINNQITDKNSGKIPPQTINTGHDFAMSAMYLCKYNTQVMNFQAVECTICIYVQKQDKNIKKNEE